jgi:DNA-binding SARP family transcriptional activator
MPGGAVPSYVVAILRHQHAYGCRAAKRQFGATVSTTFPYQGWHVRRNSAPIIDDANGEDMEFKLRLLGGFSLSQGDDSIVLPTSSQRLIALLALCARPARGHVSGTLWPDISEGRAAGRLRSTLWRIQKLCRGIIICENATLALAPFVLVDVRVLRAHAEQLIHRSDMRSAESLLRATAFVELLPGWYDDWVLVERERVRQLQLHALEVVAVQLCAVGRFGESLDAALTAVRAEPLRESAHRLVASIHMREGNWAEAMRQYRIYECIIRKELGIDPSVEFRRIVASQLPFGTINSQQARR